MKAIVLGLFFLVGCCFMVSVQQRGSLEASGGNPDAGSSASADIQTSSYGRTRSGDEVTLFTLTNENGLVLKMIDYGATVVSLETPDRDGKLANVVLTCPDIQGFEDCTMYFNGSVGRYCNRIANGRFSIGDRVFQLAKNNGDHHLHGGDKGFDKKMWKGEAVESADGVGVKFTLTSPDGDENYPGKLDVAVTYTLTNQDELVVEFRATTDKPTHVNLTNHNYWNLAGSGKILEHELKLHADRYLPVDAGGIPTGELAEVVDTPFDFNKPTAIGARFEQVGGEPVGYDHCYVVAGNPGSLRPAAVVRDRKSGRVMEIHTTEPGIQFYSGNFLDGELASGGYVQHSAFCLETQHFPDTPNRPDFPSTLLNPGDEYYHKTVHRFRVD